MQNSLNTQRTVASLTSPQDSSAMSFNVAQPHIAGISLMVALPIATLCGIVAYRKHQTIARRQKINLLNRIWQLEASPKQG